MPAYKQTRRHYEPAYGKVTDVIIFSDSYNGILDLDGAVEVNVFEIDSTEESINAGAEVFRESELQFKLKGTQVQTAEDAAAVNFVLSASNPETPVFCARIINPQTPLQAGDVDFRGRVRSDISGEAKRWKRDVEYGSTYTAWRDYNGSASVFDLKELLGAKIKDVVEQIDDVWIENNVNDELAWYRRGTREARFADMVSLSSLIQKLLDVAVTVPNTTVTYMGGETDLAGYPARFVVQNYDGKRPRYPNKDPFVPLGDMPVPFVVNTIGLEDQFRIKAGGQGLYAPYVSYRLVKPEKGSEKFSWEDWSLAQVILYLAYSFGLFVEFRYIDNFNVQIHFTKRQLVGSSKTYIDDPLKEKIDIKPLDTKDGVVDDKVSGVSTPFVKEGWRFYTYSEDGWLEQTYLPDRPEEKGEFLPVTCSPSWIFLENQGEDNGYHFSKHNKSALMPVNAVFWDDGARKEGGGESYRLGGRVDYNAAETHTGLYFKVIGSPDSKGYEYGVEGEEILLPLAIFVVKIEGKYHFFKELSHFVNFLNARGAAFYEQSHDFVIQGLCSFRSSETGPNSWQACRAGSVVTLNGIDFVISRVNRKLFETEITIRAASEFTDFADPYAGDVPQQEDLDPDNPPPVPPPSRVAAAKVTQEPEIPGEELDGFVIVKQEDDGLVYKATATRADQNKILGLSLDNYVIHAELPNVEDPIVRVVRSGPVFVGSVGVAMGLQPGDKLYLRTSPEGVVNWSKERLTGKTATEDLHCRFGYAITSEYIFVEKFDSWHFI